MQAACEVANNWGFWLARPGGLPGDFIDTEIFLRLRTLLSQLSIIVDPPMVSARLFEAPDHPVRMAAVYMKNNEVHRTLNRLQLALEILSGKLEYLPMQPTGAEGESVLTIIRTLSAGSIRMSIYPDLKALCSCNEVCFSQPIFQVLPLPKSVLTIQVPAVLVAFQTEEVNMGIKQTNPTSSALLSQSLTQSGWKIVSSGQESDFIIRMNLVAKPGVERMGVHTAFSEGTLAMIHAHTGEEVLSVTNSQVSGGGRNYEAAGRQAIEKITEWFIEELQNNLIK